MEFVYRFYDDIPLFNFNNFAKTLTRNDKDCINEFDKHLGWKLEDYSKNQHCSTLENGRRFTTQKYNDINPIIIVGDSYTVGAEVSDHESWPNHLSEILQSEVINAGVPGYGSDQINLRALDLIDKYPKAKKLIISYLIPADIQRTQYTHFGRAKPFYTVDHNNKIIYNPPGSNKVKKNVILKNINEISGYSYLIHKLVFSFGLYYYIGVPGLTFNKNESINPELVTCELLNEIKNKNKNIELYLILQYGPYEILSNKRSFYEQHISTCAFTMGYKVFSTYDLLKNILKKNKKTFNSLFVNRNDDILSDRFIYGHMSNDGNKLIADGIYKAMQNNNFYKYDEINISNYKNEYDLAASLTSNKLANVKKAGTYLLVEPKKNNGEIYVSSNNLKLSTKKIILKSKVENNNNDLLLQINNLENKELNGIHFRFKNNVMKNIREIKGIKNYSYNCNNECIFTVEFEDYINSIFITLQILPSKNNLKIQKNDIAKVYSLKLYSND